jgi:hypothetical protein
MHFLIANAESGDFSLDNIRLLLFGGLFLAVFSVMCLIPIRVAHRRHHRKAQMIRVLVILCGLLALGSVLLSLSAQQQWAREDMLRLQTGWYDPQEHQHDAPGRPWVFWGILGAVYVLLVIWAIVGGTGPAPDD